MTSPTGQFIISRDGTKIWADHAGDPSKPAIVFVPGFSCTSLAFEKQWSDPELLANIHLVRYDVRGQAQSDQPMNKEAYTSVHHAEDFKAVYDVFDLKKPFIAGWSMGGVVAVDVVSAYGADMVSGVILLGAIPYQGMQLQVNHPFILTIASQFINGNDLASWYKTVQDFVDSCVAHPEHVPAATRFTWIGVIAQQHPLVRQWSYPRVQDESKLLEVRKTLPYLVCHGRNDLHVQPDKLEAFMKSTFDDVEMHIFDDCGHAPFYERPMETNTAIINFVARVSSKEPACFSASSKKIPMLLSAPKCNNMYRGQMLRHQ